VVVGLDEAVVAKVVAALVVVAGGFEVDPGIPNQARSSAGRTGGV
jgi:hypothetical protein